MRNSVELGLATGLASLKAHPSCLQVVLAVVGVCISRTLQYSIALEPGEGFTAYRQCSYACATETRIHDVQGDAVATEMCTLLIVNFYIETLLAPTS